MFAVLSVFLSLLFLTKVFFFWIASTPGNWRPSKNCNEAPPPVEICEKLFSRPKFIIAAAESPPPIIEKAFVWAAMILAIASVPVL